MNVPNNIIVEKLEELEYPKDSEDGNSKYAYLLKLPISQLTKERKETLEKESIKIQEEIDILKAKKPQDIWLKELDDLEKQWILYKESVEDDYKKDEETLMELKKKKYNDNSTINNIDNSTENNIDNSITNDNSNSNNITNIITNVIHFNENPSEHTAFETAHITIKVLKNISKISKNEKDICNQIYKAIWDNEGNRCVKKTNMKTN
jgi:hypothetical protein